MALPGSAARKFDRDDIHQKTRNKFPAADIAKRKLEQQVFHARSRLRLYRTLAQKAASIYEWGEMASHPEDFRHYREGHFERIGKNVPRSPLDEKAVMGDYWLRRKELSLKVGDAKSYAESIDYRHKAGSLVLPVDYYNLAYLHSEAGTATRPWRPG